MAAARASAAWSGLGLVVELEDGSYHVLDLLLVCRARAHERLLDLHGSVLIVFETLVCTGDESRATRLCRGDG